MFASPGNKQIHLWVGIYPQHGDGICNSLEMNLEDPFLLKGVYANFSLVCYPKCLQSLKDHKTLGCLIVVPLCSGCSWLPLLVKRHDKQSAIIKITPSWVCSQTAWELRCHLPGGTLSLWFYQANAAGKTSAK